MSGAPPADRKIEALDESRGEGSVVEADEANRTLPDGRRDDGAGGQDGAAGAVAPHLGIRPGLLEDEDVERRGGADDEGAGEEPVRGEGRYGRPERTGK